MSEEIIVCPHPGCYLGMVSRTMKMRTHSLVPGVRCPGSGQTGRYDEEATNWHGMVGVNWALLSTPYGTMIRWRWVCTCIRRGGWAPTPEQAEVGGKQHVRAKEAGLWRPTSR